MNRDGRTGMRFISICVASAALLAAAGVAAEPQPREGTDQLVMSLSHPGEPGVLMLQHHKGTVRVTGYDGELVIVNASLRHGPPAGGKDGMRSLRGGSMRLHGLEKNNVITISTNSHERTIDLEIQVPLDFSLHLEKNDAGEIFVHRLSGEIDINSDTGDVSLTDISGSAIVSTLDGKIFARFTRVTPFVPMAFTTASGDIDVMFPGGIDASLMMRTDKGDILTDFDIDIEGKKAEVETSETTGIQRAVLEEWTHGVIGSGGPQFTFRSYQGDIFIRKSGNLSREPK
ncbi:MAG TPA: DUF4097 family beta strand repeat-containing protein [Candidatus Krumholzibacterium sp.]|nr:DUF4097 family beta strand repeat-containing protein [Candidatus Krumholzibacterium sp.]